MAEHDIRVGVRFDVDQSGAERLKAVPKDTQQAFAQLGKTVEALGGARGSLLQKAAEQINALGQHGAGQGFFTKDQRREMDKAITQVRAGIREYYQAQIDEAKKGAEKLAQEMRTLQERMAKETNREARATMGRDFVAMQHQMASLRAGGTRTETQRIAAERDRMLAMLKEQSALTQLMPTTEEEPQRQRGSMFGGFTGQFMRGMIGASLIGGIGYHLAAKIKQEFAEELQRGMAVADLSQRIRPLDMPYDQFRTFAGAVHPSFSPEESTRFLGTYATLVGGPQGVRHAGQAASLTRAFGFAPEEGASIFGQSMRLGVDQTKLAESVGQEVIRAQLQGREGEVFHSLLQMSERLIEFLGHAPNLDEMAGLIGRLSMTGLPGLQGEYGARAAMRFDEGVRGTGLFPMADMRQMALLSTFTRMGVTNPVDMLKMQEQGILGNPGLGRNILQTIEGFGGANSLLGASAIKQFGLSLGTYPQFRDALMSSEKSGALDHLRGLVGAEKLNAVPNDRLMDVLRLADRSQGMSASQAHAELAKIQSEQRPEAKVREELADLHRMEAEAVRKMIPAYEKLLSGVTEAAGSMLSLTDAIALKLKQMGVSEQTAGGVAPFVAGAGVMGAWGLAKRGVSWLFSSAAGAGLSTEAAKEAAGHIHWTQIGGRGLGWMAALSGLSGDYDPTKQQRHRRELMYGAMMGMAPTAGSPEIRDTVTQAALKEGLDPARLLALVHNESSFNANAVGPPTRYGRAYGLGQILHGKNGPFPGYSVADLKDPATNAMLSAKYFRQMLDRFGGDEDLATAAYNAGPGAVQKYGGIPPYKETQGYVERYHRNLEQEQRLSGHATVYVDVRDKKTGEVLAQADVPLSSQPTSSPAAAVR